MQSMLARLRVAVNAVEADIPSRYVDNWGPAGDLR